MNVESIQWWKTEFGEDAASAVSEAVRNKNISQGKITAEFEHLVSQFLEVPNVIATSSGSTALLSALMSVGVGPGDEVIVPNRTWIATGHAVHLLGAKVVIADVRPDSPVLNVSNVAELISERTRAIIPVYMNGRGVNLARLRESVNGRDIAVIEDAAQGFGSSFDSRYLGTQGDIACFSLSVAKIFSSGQGGFVVTSSKSLGEKLRNIRTHGVESTLDPVSWPMPGFNFRFTDIQASIAITQLRRVKERVRHCHEIHRIYMNRLEHLPKIEMLRAEISNGEVPIYAEALVEDRSAFIEFLKGEGIEARPFYPSLERALYFDQSYGATFPNSLKYECDGVYLPSGPGRSLGDIERVADTIEKGIAEGRW